MISFKKSYSVEDLNLIVLNQFIHNHEISEKIINNRDNLFISKY